jgi:hypothetical protein
MDFTKLMPTASTPPFGLPMTNEEWWAHDLDERNTLIDDMMFKGEWMARGGFCLWTVGLSMIIFGLTMIWPAIIGFILFNIGTFVVMYGHEYARRFRFYHEEA